jgi:hypothetical protein
MRYRPPTDPCAVFRTSSLPQGDPQVLGANLKCSESGLALPGHPKNSTPRYGRTAALRDFDPACIAMRINRGPTNRGSGSS